MSVCHPAPTRSGVPDGRASTNSMPRAALLSIHARIEGTGASTWEDPSLVQVWGPRFSAYVVPAIDRAIFTLSRLPDEGRSRAIALDMANRLDALLAGRTMSANEAGHALGLDHPNQLRYAALTGRVLIRWDGAKRPTIWTVPGPDVDPQEARAELARRYLHVLGPGTAEAFAEWAGIKPPRGRAAFEAIGHSLTAVKTPIGDGWILSEDEASFKAPPRPTAAARLLPSGDAYYLLQGIPSRAPGAAGGPSQRPVDLPGLAWRGSDRRRSRGGLVMCECRSHDSAVAPRLSCGTPGSGSRSGLVPAPRPRSHPRAMGGPCVVVGARGFEPPTPWPPAKCAARLRHAPTERESGPVYGPLRRASRSAPGHVSISADPVRRVAVRPMTTSVQAI